MFFNGQESLRKEAKDDENIIGLIYSYLCGLADHALVITTN
jgi:hypothetical protein